MLKDRIFQARAVISNQVERDDRGIFMIRASVFRCFLSLIEKDAGLITDDLGARMVWNGHTLDAFDQTPEWQKPEGVDTGALCITGEKVTPSWWERLRGLFRGTEGGGGWGYLEPKGSHETAPFVEQDVFLDEVGTYIVRSGNGYFLKFENGCPLMDTDPVRAYRMKGAEALGVMKAIENLGFVGGLVKVVYGRMKVGSR